MSARPEYPSLPMTFLGLDPVPWESARVAVLPLPYDSTTSYRSGTRHGPAAILEASRQVERWDEETGSDATRLGIHTLPEVAPDMRGPGAMLERVFQAARQVVSGGRFLLGLGGEQSLSLGMIRAVQEKHPDLSVLHIDAHLDLKNTYEDTPFSHLSVMRRVRDVCPVVPVGIRNVSREEAEYVEAQKVRVFYARDIVGKTGWEHQVVDQLSKSVYVSIDVDGFDPSVFPATGMPEPGGLGWFEGLRLLRMVAKHRNVVGADVMELSPQAGLHHPQFAAARLAYKILAYAYEGKA